MNHGNYVISERLVSLIHQNFQGFHPGYRDVHSNGRYYAATFTATPMAKKLSRAIHLQGQATLATVRFSISASGNPLGPPSGASMSVKFFLPNGTVSDLIMLQLPLFPTRTPEETAEFLEAVKPSSVGGEPNPEQVRLFASTRPTVAYALKVIGETVKPPLSFAQTMFNALHAFRFVNETNEAVYGRYHCIPIAGTASQTKEELLSKPLTYLYEELEARLRLLPVEFELVLELAGDGDSVIDPSSQWAEGRERVCIGRLKITRPTTNEEIGDAVMSHDPTRLTDGIEASDDPILAARRGVYELSVANRTGGWRGRCPFSSEIGS